MPTGTTDNKPEPDISWGQEAPVQMGAGSAVGATVLPGYQAPPPDLSIFYTPGTKYGPLASGAVSATTHGETPVLATLADETAKMAELKARGREMAGQADTINPQAPEALRAREGEYRQRAMARADQLAAMAARARTAPSLAASQTSSMQSKLGGTQRAALAQGGGLLGQRQGMVQGAAQGGAIVADAAGRAGAESVDRLGEQGQYLSGSGQVLGHGLRTSSNLLTTGADTARRALLEQNRITGRAAGLTRDVARGEGALYENAGRTALDWARRRGMAGANVRRNILLEDAATAASARRREDLQGQKDAAEGRMVGTTVGMTGGFFAGGPAGAAAGGKVGGDIGEEANK